MSFTDQEVAYLRSQRLARLATVAPDGQPDVVPVGFEFERQGARYDHFDVSTDGFITFARVSHRGSPPARVRLVEEATRLGGGRLTYEVQGMAPRRCLVVSLTEDGPLAATLRVTVHERTGIVSSSDRLATLQPGEGQCSST